MDHEAPPEAAGGRTDHPIRLAVLSERRLVREALYAYFEPLPDYALVGSTTPWQLPALCALRRPQVAVIDVGSADSGTVEALRALRATFPDIALVVTYTSVDTPALVPALDATASALIPSSWGLLALARAVHRHAGRAQQPAPRGRVLTDRDLAVVSLLGSGHSVAEIADRLGISPHAIEGRKRRVYAKLGVDNQSHAVSRAMSLGLIDAPHPAGIPPTGPPACPGTPLILVLGASSASLDAVTATIERAGLPSLLVGQACPTDADQQLRRMVHHDRQRLAGVLVDPGPRHWTAARALGAPIVVVLPDPPSRAHVIDALLRGASAVLPRTETDTQLIPALSMAAHGYVSLPAGYLQQTLTGGPQALSCQGGVPVLTLRERQILDSIAAGRTVRQTARALGIAPKTVENIQTRLFSKVGARNRAQTLTAAYRLGLLDPASASCPPGCAAAVPDRPPGRSG